MPIKNPCLVEYITVYLDNLADKKSKNDYGKPTQWCDRQQFRQRVTNLKTILFGALVAAILCAPLQTGALAATQSLNLRLNNDSVVDNGATKLANTNTRSVTLTQMGRPNGLQLTGLNAVAKLNSGVRLDEIVEEATLRLKALYPPGMTYAASYIRVVVNGQAAGVHQFEANKAGEYHLIDIPLQSALFSDFADIRLEFLGSPLGVGEMVCLSPNHPSLRLDIAPESALILKTRPLIIVDDLAILPAPFFDPRDQDKLKLKIVMPSAPSLDVLRSAGILTSWFGAQASYRQAEFEPMGDIPQDDHVVILSLGEELPQGMKPEELTGPTLSIDSSNTKPWLKRLYVIGRNAEELEQAVLGLVLESQALSGKTAVVEKLSQLTPREPYDAPRYVPTNRAVKFAELLDYPTQLEVDAETPTTRLNLRLPPDLFSWAGKNIDLSLKYRYTAPSKWNDSILTVTINDNLLQSLRLPPRSEQDSNRFSLNLLSQQDLIAEEALQIPAFRVASNNQLAFSFYFAEEGQRSCSGEPLNARGSLDPESTVDFSDLPHYIQMPNLAAFANGGYPFSIYADMSDTAVVLPNSPSASEIKAFLNVSGLFGQWTGLAATELSVTTADSLEAVKDKHLLSLGAVDRQTWLEPYQMALPMRLEETKREVGNWSAVKAIDDMINPPLDPIDNNKPYGSALLSTTGALGAIMGFESPFSEGKAVIVLTGTDEPSFNRAVNGLSDYGDVASIRGSISLMRGDTIHSFKAGDTYVAGSLPWYLRLRIVFSEYPVLIAVAGAFGGILLAIVLFGWLSKRANRRLEG